MSMRTPLGKVRGLGSAKEGAAHFWAQRVTAVALVPLALYFVWAFVANAGANYETAVAWVSRPLTAIGLLLLVLTGFYHMRLGVQVVIEDYIHKESTKILLVVLNTFWAAAAGLACVYAILKIGFGA